MKKFTYIDYIKYQRYIDNINYFKNVLREDSEPYKYDRKSVYHKHDKIFREILEDKSEIANLINKILKLENKKEALTEKDLERYKRKFVTDNFKYAETDIIYRKKGEDIFFLIEHQSTIDYSMPYRILMYSLEIIKSVIDERQLRKKAYKFPMVYPIIIYTGSKKWNVEKYIEEKQQKIPGCEPVRFYEYNVVDVNEYTEEELLNSQTFLTKVMLLEKAKTSQEVITNLNKITDIKLTDKNAGLLKRIIYYIFRKEIGEEEANKLLDKLEIKKGGTDMLEDLLHKGFMEELEKLKKKIAKETREKATEEGRKKGLEQGIKEGLEQGIKEGMEQGIKEGIEQGKKEAEKIIKQDMENEWIEKMVKNNLENEKILKITGITEEKLEKIKDKINKKAS